MADGNQPAEDLSNAYARLSPKRRLFVDKLCATGKKAQSAIDAGFGPKRPDVAAAKLLAIPLVRAAYEQRMEELSEEAGIEAQRILQGVAAIAYNEKIKAIVRLKGYELLGKHKKLWTDKHELAGPGGGPIPTSTESIDPIEAARRYKQLMDGTA